MSNVITFTPKAMCPRHAVALGNTQSGVWLFETVASDEGDLSISASNDNGLVMSIHPAVAGWAVVDEDGHTKGVHRSPVDAVQAIIGG